MDPSCRWTAAKLVKEAQALKRDIEEGVFSGDAVEAVLEQIDWILDAHRSDAKREAKSEVTSGSSACKNVLPLSIEDMDACDVSLIAAVPHKPWIGSSAVAKVWGESPVKTVIAICRLLSAALTHIEACERGDFQSDIELWFGMEESYPTGQVSDEVRGLKDRIETEVLIHLKKCTFKQ